MAKTLIVVFKLILLKLDCNKITDKGIKQFAK